MSRDLPDDVRDLDPQMRETESTFTQFRPAATEIHRSTLLVEAGRTMGRLQARRELFAWRAAVAVLVCALTARQLRRPGQSLTTHETLAVFAHVDPSRPSGAQSASPLTTEVSRENSDSISAQTPVSPGSSYFALRDAVLRVGLRAFPAPPPMSAASVPPEPTVESLLGLSSVPEHAAQSNRLRLQKLLRGERL